MARQGRSLNRLLRVRALQHDLTRAAEVQARAKVEQEAQLRARIASLAANVAPVTGDTAPSATSLIASAHYRDRLHQSAHAAARRVSVAEQGLDQARAATRDARRDQGAIEKLIAREEAAAARKALRELEAMPPAPKNRHDLC